MCFGICIFHTHITLVFAICFTRQKYAPLHVLFQTICNTAKKLKRRLLDDSLNLDDDALTALAAYTFDNGKDRESNIYFAFNQALRGRMQDPATFGKWQVRKHTQ